MLQGLILWCLILFTDKVSSYPPLKTVTVMSHQEDEGGAINEKARNTTSTMGGSSSSSQKSATAVISAFSPSTARSHLWHALEGLDRYPNYLSRWNDERDIDELERSLEQSLKQVRQQRGMIMDRRQRIEQLLQNVTIPSRVETPESWEDLLENRLDSTLGKAIQKSRQFRNKRNIPSLHKVLSGEFELHLDAYLLEQLMEPEVHDVYSLPIFRRDFCEDMVSYIRKVSAILEKNEITIRPIDLDVIGLQWINNVLLHLILRPICRHLFKDTEMVGGDLDWRQGYVATYKAQSSNTKIKQHNRLVTHTDDSEITLNVGLGDDFDGGMLQFWGLRGEKDQELLGSYSPVPGQAVLHAGRHFHQVTRVTKGERYALILWARSWSGVRTQTCPCCWLTRRRDNNCICGPRWN